jgi:hypothetical protein
MFQTLDILTHLTHFRIFAKREFENLVGSGFEPDRPGRAGTGVCPYNLFFCLT